MENLDDFMKKKFLEDPGDGGRFAFKEEYWQQAEALIAADEKRRRRRRRFWWWTGGSLLLAGIAAGLWWYGLRAPETGNQAVSENAVTASPSADRENNFEKNQRHAGDSTATIFSASSATGQTREQTSLVEKTKIFPTRLPSVDRPNAQTRAGGTLKNPSRQSDGAASLAKPAAASESPAPRTTNIPGVNPTADSADHAVPTTAGKPVHPPADTSTAVSPDVPARPGSVRILALLPLPRRPLVVPPPRLPKRPPAPVPVAESPKPTPDGRFSLSLAAFGTGYTPAESGQGFGVGAGLIARYRLGASFALQAEALWRMRAMSAGPEPASARQVRYGFGYESDRYELAPTASHWLEIPLAVQWQRGRWSAGVGVAPGFLLGVQGRLTHERETSLSARTVTREAVQLDKKPFYPNYVAAFGGGQYALTRRLNLGLRLHYLGGDFRRPADDFQPSRQTLWADLGLRYEFN